MRELWAFILVCSAVFAAFATAMLVVLVQSGRHKDMVGITALMVIGGWVLAYLAFKMLMAIPKKKEDIW
jgi:threonine/homoserine/homoserine lactone efflux protein